VRRLAPFLVLLLTFGGVVLAASPPSLPASQLWIGGTYYLVPASVTFDWVESPGAPFNTSCSDLGNGGVSCTHDVGGSWTFRQPRIIINPGAVPVGAIGMWFEDVSFSQSAQFAFGCDVQGAIASPCIFSSGSTTLNDGNGYDFLACNYNNAPCIDVRDNHLDEDIFFWSGFPGTGGQYIVAPVPLGTNLSQTFGWSASYWVVDLGATPTPVATATPDCSGLGANGCQDYDTGGFGSACTYTYEDNTTEVVEANLINNGSFEYIYNYFPWGWSEQFGSLILGNAVAHHGTYSLHTGSAGLAKLVRQEFQLPFEATHLYVGIHYLPSIGNDVAVDVFVNDSTVSENSYSQCVLGECPGWVPTDSYAYDVSSLSGQFIEVSYLIFPSTHIDGAFAYPAHGAGEFELICPDPETNIDPTPTPQVTLPPITPLSTVAATPTAGPVQSTIVPPVTVVAQPTECFGWAEQDLPLITDTLPAFSLCIEPQQYVVDPNADYLGDVFALGGGNLWSLAAVVLTGYFAITVIQMVRKR
jgi:hypothetical protein